MTPSARIPLGMAWLASVVTLSSLSALGENPNTNDPQSLGERLRPGATLTVAAQSASLMLGQQVVAVLSRGESITIGEIRDGWVGTHVLTAGKPQAGWIRWQDFVNLAPTPTPAAASHAASQQVYTAYRPLAPAAAAPGAWMPSQAAPVRAEYGRGEWDAYLIGRYQRHETEPNIHVWEPWRHR